MPPNSEDLGTIGFRKRVPGYNFKAKGAHDWLNGKRQIEGAENYWRIQDDLYDLTDFVNIHPGGSEWLELTQGTDITEAFECHHIFENAEDHLQKFRVKKAKTPRNSPYTFKEDGFYRTLKKRLRPILKSLPDRAVKLTAFYIDSLLFLTIISSILALKFFSLIVGAAAGVSLSMMIIAAHNYFHQRDNFRMYYFHLCLLSVRDWRVSHALSHHLFPNTIVDMEMYIFDPLAKYYPAKKNFVQKYLSWILSPILYAFVFHTSVVFRIMESIKQRNIRNFTKFDLIPFLLPLLMYFFSEQSILSTLAMWNFILLCGSFHFSVVGINAGHHHPDVFHDGDTPREEKDFGIAQLDTLMERSETTGNHFLVLTNFGDHALHHLFPTIDHGLLKDLYPVFNKTMQEFGVGLRMNCQLNLLKGQFMQLSRSDPNPNPPDLTTSKCR